MLTVSVKTVEAEMTKALKHCEKKLKIYRMNMNRTERNRIKTDRAWSKLYQRLEEDRLIPAKEDKKLRMSPLWKWGAVAAALLAALVYAGVRYFQK